MPDRLVSLSRLKMQAAGSAGNTVALRYLDVAVPVLRWIGVRIAAVDALSIERKAA
jgi:hypothetical protein